MADAVADDAHVDAVELDTAHADIARAKLGREGLSDGAHIFQGDAREVVPTLVEPYDIVFADSGVDSGTMPHMNRLTRPSDVPPQIKG